MEKKIEVIDVEIRLPVLRAALLIESFTSSFLAFLLDIPDYRKAKSLSGRTGLSFNQKVFMLIDIGALNKEHQSLFQKFMEIRNIFMHDLEAKSYEIVFQKLPSGSDNFLFKRYKPDDTKTREGQLEYVVMQLADDVLRTTINLIEKLKKKAEDKAQSELNAKAVEAFKETVANIKEALNEYAEMLISEGETMNTKTLGGLGDKMSKLFYQLAAQKMGWNRPAVSDESEGASDNNKEE